jgi:hypothetical protein
MDWNGRRITGMVENALLEDRATSDATSYACIDPGQRASGTIIAKQECILAGLGCVPRILDVYALLDGAVTSHYEVTSHPEIFDGVRLHERQTIAVLRHNARVVLSCERVILNFLQRLSGIATLTRKFVDAVSGTRARILDTRKTAPGLRILDKYAVRCGEASRPRWNGPTATGADRSPSRWKSGRWRNWKMRWLMVPRLCCWTTWRWTRSSKRSRAVPGPSGAFPWSVPEALAWRTCGPMPRREWILSRSER